MRLRNKTSASTVKSVARKSTGTRPFPSTSKEQSTSNTITENEGETKTIQTQSVRRGRSSKFSEIVSSNDKEYEMAKQPPGSRRGRSGKVCEETPEPQKILECHYRRRGRPRKVLEETPNEMTLENNSIVPVSPGKSVAKTSTGTRAIQSTSQQEIQKFLECHDRRRGRPRKVLEETPDEMAVENDTNISLPPRKCIAKKSTGTRVIQSKSQQQEKSQDKKKETASFPVTEPQNESDGDMIASDVEDVTNDVQDQSEPDWDMTVDEEETGKKHETQSHSEHRRHGKSRIFLEETGSSSDNQETLLQSQHYRVGLSRKVHEGVSNERTVENDTDVSVSSRKRVAKKSTGTRAIQSKGKQVKKKTAPFPVTEAHIEQNKSDVDIATSDVEEMSQDKIIAPSFLVTYKAQNEQNGPAIDIVSSDVEGVTNDVQEEQAESDIDKIAADEEEESPLKNRKNPVCSRKKMQKKRVDDDYEESDEESPDRNRKKSACSPRKTQKNHVDSDEDYEEADEEPPDRNRKKSACSSRKTQKNRIDSDQDYEEADEEGPSTSRIRLRNIGKIDKETLIHKCVYYLLIADQKKHAIKRTDIMKHVIKGPQQLYSNVIDGANEVLKKTYGMEITYLRKGDLMLVNNLTQELDVQQYSCLSGVKKQQQGLILYLLLIIYMNENSISENDLWKALVPLGINPSTQKSHPIFGDVQKYINSELVKQMYLDYVCISKDPPHYEYRWGPRAESEVDKSDLLHFACLVLDKKPEDWILQYKDATESAETQDSVENS